MYGWCDTEYLKEIAKSLKEISESLKSTMQYFEIEKQEGTWESDGKS